MIMDLGMIILCILYLCGTVSGTVLAIYGIVFACMVGLGSIIREMEKRKKG